MVLGIGNGVVFRIFFVDGNIVVGFIVIPGCDTFVNSLFLHAATFEVYFVFLRQYAFFWVVEIYISYFYFVFNILRWNVFSYIMLLLRFNNSIIKNFYVFVLILLLVASRARHYNFIWDLALNRIKIELNLFFFNFRIWKYRESLRRSHSWFILIIYNNWIIYSGLQHLSYLPQHLLNIFQVLFLLYEVMLHKLVWFHFLTRNWIMLLLHLHLILIYWLLKQ